MAKTETNLDKLVINYLTETQFDAAKNAGTLDANQLYFTPITEDDRIGAYVPDSSSVMEIDRANKILDTKDYYTTGQIDLKLDKQDAAIATKADGVIVTNALKTNKAEFDEHLADGTQHKKTARFVVGTSTAGWTSADCDYLCDGTADQMEINNAITALPATGGEIVILDGTYNITAKIDVTKDNVSIRGNGNATILKRMFNSSVAEGIITLTSRSGCKIANLQIDGNRENYSSSYSFDIYLNSSSSNTIAGNTCNNSSYGIHLYNSSNNNVITGNICNNNRYNHGIFLGGSNNNTITGNACNNNSYGIQLYNSENNVVTGNTCNDNKYGIFLNGSNNTLTGNTCNNNNEYGIWVEYKRRNAVIGNVCNNNTRGICLDTTHNNVVTGNICNINNDVGVYITKTLNSTVTGNTCNDNIYGIFIANSSNNNTITGNSCIRDDGLSTDYAENQYTIKLAGNNNTNNLIAMNNCMGKAVTNEGGTGNTLVYNKYNAS